MYRQGDILVEPVEQAPENVEDRGTRVVLEGEQSGHAHRLDAGTTLEDPENEEQIYLSIPEEGAVLDHEEHEAIELESGTYQVVRQREFDPTDNRTGARSSTRYVMD